MAFTAEVDQCYDNPNTGKCEVVCILKEDGEQIASFTFTDDHDNIETHLKESAKTLYIHWKERVEVIPAPSEVLTKKVWNIDENTGDLS